MGVPIHDLLSLINFNKILKFFNFRKFDSPTLASSQVDSSTFAEPSLALEFWAELLAAESLEGRDARSQAVERDAGERASARRRHAGSPGGLRKRERQPRERANARASERTLLKRAVTEITVKTVTKVVTLFLFITL